MENGSIMKKWVFLLQQKVQEPTDVASLVMLRIVFGLLMFFEIVRYFHIGWEVMFMQNLNFISSTNGFGGSDHCQRMLCICFLGYLVFLAF